MLVTDKLIYLQMPKTGSTQITKLLQIACNGEKIGEKHNQLLEPTTKKVVGSIRNPWDWYVSLWAFSCMKKGGVYKRLLAKNREVWEPLFEDCNSPELFQKWLKLMMKTQGGGRFTYHPTSNFAGIMTFQYCFNYLQGFPQDCKAFSLEDLIIYDKENNWLQHLIHTENLLEETVQVARATGHHIDENTESMMKKLSLARRAASEHQETSFYYNDETFNLVTQYDKFIVDKHGYNMSRT